MRSKYNNKKTTTDRIKFDSIKEAKRYTELRLLEKAGEIKDLTVQPKFTLQCAFTDNMGEKHRPITYIADFRYEEKGKTVVEDVKSSAHFQTEVYRIKKKLFLYGYQDVIFRETY